MLLNSLKYFNNILSGSLSGNLVVDSTSLFDRTIKSAVQAELTIPAQTRYLFPIHLGRVERHVSTLPTSPKEEYILTFTLQVYDENLDKALRCLELDARGVTTSLNGEVDTAALRTWLRKLRQICTHPQVGQLQKHGDKSSKSGVLKTMRQILEGMKDQNWRNVMDDRRSKARSDIISSLHLY